jgi:hypothetical protein
MPTAKQSNEPSIKKEAEFQELNLELQEVIPEAWQPTHYSHHQGIQKRT